jgi:integrase
MTRAEYIAKARRRICERAGLQAGRKAGVTFHDIRRTSARTKRAAGVDTSVTMAMMGWKSEAMFRRYGIVDIQDKMAALEKQAAYEGEVLSN